MIRQKIITYEEEIPKDLEGFRNWEFSSGGEDFEVFSRLFKGFIKSNIPKESELVEFNSGHYYVSGFIRRGNKVVYFSISDVRHFQNEWATNILIRTAKDEKDYTGGSNGYTMLESFEEDINKLLS